MDQNKTGVPGLEYIGVSTACLLSSKGDEVVGVDLNTETVQTINQGRIHIVESDLQVVCAGRRRQKSVRPIQLAKSTSAREHPAI